MSATTTRPKCSIPSCTNRAKAYGKCSPHYHEQAAARPMRLRRPKATA